MDSGKLDTLWTRKNVNIPKEIENSWSYSAINFYLEIRQTIYVGVVTSCMNVLQ